MREKNAENMTPILTATPESDICFIFRDMIEMTLSTTFLKIIRFI